MSVSDPNNSKKDYIHTLNEQTKGIWGDDP